MAIVARGRIADTGEDTFTSSMHHDYMLANEQYILADEQGHEILIPTARRLRLHSRPPER